MIFITVKFKVRPEYRDGWLSRVEEFTRATRAEAGNLWFEWSRAVDDPGEFVLVEAFRDARAGEEHVTSEHFRRGLETMREALSETPRIINTEVPGTDWSRMGELSIPATP
ncbi:antibiotic biosynthesis monooxygenase [Streptomyces sp. AJS327]|uniref:putative quinol monooxygenase n=1 Tax=Streptomyces sp. AJS327 TaxID=2545265 RepID=UPI0015DE03E1|nr:putative quinol monooxygenase [Streptomyces sp. AJS327]MBA0052606.1 antibiotic biosynthesis monooxygenase [Streptomyces sp. AJS327]